MPQLRESFDATVTKAFFVNRPITPSADPTNVSDLRKRLERTDALLDADDEFYVLNRGANIAASWLSLVAGALLADFDEQGGEEPVLDEQIAGLAFFSRLANDLWAIIELAELGFDLQARALTRAYLEHVDVLICCLYDRDLTKAFVDAIEPEDANRFWHRNVSKGKAKARVAQIVSSKLGLEHSRLVDLLREDADTAGAILLHPSVGAGLAAAFGNDATDYRSYPIFPEPMAASASIFRTILIHLLWLRLAMGPLPKQRFAAWRGLIRTRRLLDNAELERATVAYGQLFTFLLDNQLLMTTEGG